MKQAIFFSLVGLMFLTLFLPYVAYKGIEWRVRGGLTETQIINRLSGMALDHLFEGETA